MAAVLTSLISYAPVVFITLAWVGASATAVKFVLFNQ